MAKEDFIASFIELVEKQGGFEIVHAYRDEVDHFLGGKGDRFWYVIQKDGSFKVAYVALFVNGEWKDKRVTGKGKKQKTADLPAGATIKRIVEKAYLAQDENWVTDRKPRLIQDAHPHFHYTKGFGDKAVDISEEFGVTIRYSDIADVSTGFHERDISTGESVEPPKDL